MMQAFEMEYLDTDQVFSYWMGGTQLIHINASLLDRVRKIAPGEFRKFTLPITKDIYEMYMEHRGIEEPRVERLRGKHLREPGMIVLWEGDKMHQNIPDYTMVDGHHRYVRRYRGGLTFMDCWACLPRLWKQCVMPSTPEIDAQIAKITPPPVKENTSFIHTVTSRGA